MKISKVITPFLAMEVLEKAEKMERKGEHIIHLEIGEPDFETPQCIKESALKAMKDGKTHYTHSLGILELRNAISEYYYNKYKIEVSPDRIIVTSGSSIGFLLIFFVLISSSLDEVFLTNPHYPCYPKFVKLAGGRVKYVKIYENDGFQPDVNEYKKRISKNSKAVLLNSPANPTGVVIEKNNFEKIYDLFPYIISDEIYHGLCYEGNEFSAINFPLKNIFIVGGFSKLYAMTGWRVGYVIAPKKFIRQMQKIHQNISICAPSISQWAAISALKYSQNDVSLMVKEYDKRRRYMLSRIEELGLALNYKPTGAFYIFVNTSRFSIDSYRLALKILEEAKVAVTPGVDFGQNGEGYIRFSYTNSIQNIEEGINRLKIFFNKYSIIDKEKR